MNTKITITSDEGRSILSGLAGQNAHLAQPALDGIEFFSMYPHVDSDGRLTGETRDANWPRDGHGDWVVCDCDEDGVTVIDYEWRGDACMYAINN